MVRKNTCQEFNEGDIVEIGFFEFDDKHNRYIISFSIIEFGLVLKNPMHPDQNLVYILYGLEKSMILKERLRKVF